MRDSKTWWCKTWVLGSCPHLSDTLSNPIMLSPTAHWRSRLYMLHLATEFIWNEMRVRLISIRGLYKGRKTRTVELKINIFFLAMRLSACYVLFYLACPYHSVSPSSVNTDSWVMHSPARSSSGYLTGR